MGGNSTTTEGAMQLARAVIKEAFKAIQQDADDADDAADFLQSDWGAYLMESLDLDFRHVGAAIERVREGPPLRYTNRWYARA